MWKKVEHTRDERARKKEEEEATDENFRARRVEGQEAWDTLRDIALQLDPKGRWTLRDGITQDLVRTHKLSDTLATCVSVSFFVSFSIFSDRPPSLPYWLDLACFRDGVGPFVLHGGVEADGHLD